VARGTNRPYGGPIEALTPFDCCLQDEGGEGVRLAVTGELDRATVPRFERAVADLHDPNRLVIDLDKLAFIDAGGLRAIIDMARQAERSGRSVQLANPSPSLRRLFTLTGLERSVKLVSD
jgi:anti-sigma B factor antagonist